MVWLRAEVLALLYLPRTTPRAAPTGKPVTRKYYTYLACHTHIWQAGCTSMFMSYYHRCTVLNWSSELHHSRPRPSCHGPTPQWSLIHSYHLDQVLDHISNMCCLVDKHALHAREMRKPPPSRLLPSNQTKHELHGNKSKQAMLQGIGSITRMKLK